MNLTSGTIVDGTRPLDRKKQKFTSVTINDPETHTRTVWTTQAGALKQAYVSHMESRKVPEVSPQRLPEIAPDRGGPVAQRVREDLGTKTTAGVDTQGTRITTFYPADYDGNNIAYSSIQEVWHSKEYHMDFVRTTDSPQAKTSRKVTAFTAGEPDAGLFQPPADYTIVDDKR